MTQVEAFCDGRAEVDVTYGWTATLELGELETAEKVQHVPWRARAQRVGCCGSGEILEACVNRRRYGRSVELAGV